MKSQSENLDSLETRTSAAWLRDITALFLIYLLILLFFTS